MGRYKSKLSPEEKLRIVDAYVSGMPIAEMEKKFGHNMKKMREVLEDCGVPNRRKAYEHRMYYETKNDTKCWNCARSAAAPNYQCSWERSFTPVSGWDAKKVIRRQKITGSLEVSYFVRDCPLYVKWRRGNGKVCN